MRCHPLACTAGLLAACSLLLAARLCWVNQYHGAELTAMAQNQRLASTPACEFARGDFLDRHGYAITGRAERVLLVFPAQLEQTAEHLVALLDKIAVASTANIPAKLAAGRPFVLARGLTQAQAQAANALISGQNGIFCTTYHPRYASGSPAAHIIGYVNSNGTAQSGLELQYDDVLQGRSCPSLAIPCDEQGRQAGDTLRVIQPNKADTADSAHNIRLTLDFAYQQILEAAMRGKCGAAVLMDVTTGDVLAMCSTPGYDQSVGQPPTTGDAYINKATAYFPPASVFKLVLAAATLEENISPGNTADDENFVCNGAVTLSTGQTVHCWQSSGHGAEDMSAALANSCNPYFITLGQRLGGKLISQYAWRLGLTEQLLRGFNVNSQNMLNFNANVPADVANVSIGEKGIRTTPLMIARLLAAIANDGLLPEPRLVIDIEDDNGRISQTVPAATPRRVISSNTARSLRQMLQNAVQTGTAGPVASSIISIGGKTGTSQNFGVWFAGFFPADSPRWSLAVYIADGTSGGKSAGSVCREVAEKLAQLEGIAGTGSV